MGTAPEAARTANAARAVATPPTEAAAMTAVIGRFGALGVFMLMVPESACIPIPSEVTLLFSGFAVSQGWMSFVLAVVAATAGNVIGAVLAYALGQAAWFLGSLAPALHSLAPSACSSRTGSGPYSLLA
jgi:membrane protein YqaA with SNARE-associated domain